MYYLAYGHAGELDEMTINQAATQIAQRYCIPHTEAVILMRGIMGTRGDWDLLSPDTQMQILGLVIGIVQRGGCGQNALNLIG